jgi:hypothetical protein
MSHKEVSRRGNRSMQGVPKSEQGMRRKKGKAYASEGWIGTLEPA